MATDILFCCPDRAKWFVYAYARICITNLINAYLALQRLAKWFTTLSPKDKAKIVKDVSQLVLARRTRMCNFLEYKGSCRATRLQY